MCSDELAGNDMQEFGRVGVGKFVEIRISLEGMIDTRYVSRDELVGNDLNMSGQDSKE